MSPLDSEFPSALRNANSNPGINLAIASEYGRRARVGVGVGVRVGVGVGVGVGVLVD
jgi:hypothetical protein